VFFSFGRPLQLALDINDWSSDVVNGMRFEHFLGNVWLHSSKTEKRKPGDTMKKFSLLALSVCISASVFASPGKYSCTLVNEFDDWLVHVDLSQNKAAFFDNDHWSQLTLVPSARSSVQKFAGSDSLNEARKIEFRYNATAKHGTLTDDVGGERQRSYRFKCNETDETGGIE
jgi:hypothetical protein